MKLEDIFNAVKKEGVEMWDITDLLQGPLIFWGVMIDNKQVAKELKRMYKNDKESLNTLYEKINAPLIVLEKYDGKPRLSYDSFAIYQNEKEIQYIDTDDMLGAKVYTLSKNKTVTLKKTDEYSNYIYESFKKDINSNGFKCLHKDKCPVSYLDKWHKGY